MKSLEKKSVRDFFDKEFFNSMLQQNVHSRSKIIYLHPKDFLALARRGHGDKKEKRVDKYLSEGNRFPDLPYLWIDTIRKDTKDFDVIFTPNKCKVIAHEGRHRVRALHKLGFTAVPVVINSTASLDLCWAAFSHRPKTVVSEDGYKNFDFAEIFDETFYPKEEI